MISAYLSRWKKIGIKHIQFRKNYMQTTLDNLYVEDGIQKLLGSMFTSDHSNDKVCRMRTGYYYKDQDGMKISYHKTLPFSIIKEPEGLYIYNVLYDIIINQDGSLDADWDGTPLDVEAYKTVIYEKEK